MEYAAVPLSSVVGDEEPTSVCEMPVCDSFVAEPPDAPAAGYKERFGRYLLLERLGQGGMAEVFKAVAEGAHGFRRVFVVKRILPQFADSAYFVSLFADEAKLSALLHHPNLVQVYEFGAVAGTHYLSMEYLDGTDLASVLSALAKRGRRLTPPMAAFIAEQVAHGLAYAHAARDGAGAPLRLVHRDVSPENIMLMDAGTVKLFDFGIALSDHRLASSVTQGKVMKGKLAYASPEQVKGLPLDGRSDIFSLGVVLWEMLTCRRLFLGDSDARTLYNVLEKQVLPPSQVAAGVPQALDAVVLRALARDPASRYQTADELAEDLHKVLRATPHHVSHLPKLLKRLFDGRPAPRKRTTAKEIPVARALPNRASSDAAETPAECAHGNDVAAASPSQETAQANAVEASTSAEDAEKAAVHHGLQESVRERVQQSAQDSLEACGAIGNAGPAEEPPLHAIAAFARKALARPRQWTAHRTSGEAGALAAVAAAACVIALCQAAPPLARTPARHGAHQLAAAQTPAAPLAQANRIVPPPLPTYGAFADEVVGTADVAETTFQAVVEEAAASEVVAPAMARVRAPVVSVRSKPLPNRTRAWTRPAAKHQVALRASLQPRPLRVDAPPLAATHRPPSPTGIHVDPFVR